MRRFIYLVFGIGITCASISAMSVSDIDSIPNTDTIVNDTLQIATDSSCIISDTISDKSLLNITDTLPVQDTFTIIAVGDIMLGTDYPSPSYLPPNNNCYAALQHIKPLLQNGDVTFGNCEGVFAGDQGTPKKCNNPKTCYAFRMPESCIDCFVDAGFSLLSVANNHVNDFGYKGKVNTIEVIKKSGIHFAGFETVPYTIFEKNNLKIGFAAVSPSDGTLNMLDTNRVAKVLSLLNDSCNIVILSMHAGAEGKNYQHVTKQREYFYEQDRGNVYEFARFAIDNGADIIIGHGPHVTRAVDIYNNRFIAYSLGNFATYARFNLSGPNGIAPMLKIKLTETGEFIEAEVISIYQDGEGIPKLDPLNRAWKTLVDLTNIDLPQTRLNFENNTITKFHER